jgi:LmbE family N-acetylglucosaminyl deacetylase
MSIKPKLFAIFAHPDDEAFGPAGYLLKASEKYEVHCVCVTNGAHGKNDDGVELKQVRQRELMSSASILGIHHVHFLHYEDGSLCNSIYHKIVSTIEILLDKYKPEEIVTFEPRGVSGHLDHIAVTSIVSYLYEKKSYIKQVLYFVLPHEYRSKIENYFVHMPPGYKKEQIDLIIPIEDVWEKKVQAILCHKSQKADSSRLLKLMEDLPKEESFLVLKKT